MKFEHYILKNILNWLDHNLLRILIGFLIAFIPLWPKIPAIGIPHTWVYIRLEDFFIAAAFLWGFILLFRKKVSLNTPLTIPIVLYWIAGGLSLAFTLLFTAKHLANFFPNVAIFHYLRRIEYLGIFFLAFWSVKSPKDFSRYLTVYLLTLSGVIFYGFGQRLLGFPAFLTMNEEFAKGVPLYLSPTSRLTSTFAGHYDLAAFLVLMIAFFTGIFFGLKNFFIKLLVLVLNILSLILLLMTASRISFLVYLLTISITLFWLRKKTLIIPVIVFSIAMMLLVSGASERFLKTIRVRQVVYDATTGQAIGTLEQAPVGSIQNKDKVYVPITTETQESLPVGSGFIDLPGADQEATTVATIKKPVLMSLKMSTISAEIATISGKFLVRNALVYDISFTTRIQGEWPRAISAFKRNIIFGSGYSSISLSNDNDYLRMLAETGLLGSFAFIFIFYCLFFFLLKEINTTEVNFLRNVGFGLIGGITGMFVNAIFIDVFEASKLAYTLWLLAGITCGTLALKYQNSEGYRFQLTPLISKLKYLLTRNLAIFIYFLIVIFLLFGDMISAYFIGDDFTWLKWASVSDFKDISSFFTSASGFFYRPLAKLLYFFLYNAFWLKPEAYHISALILHGACAYLVYLIGNKLFHKKIISLITSLLFVILAIHGESLFWLSASFELIGPFFALMSIYFYLEKQKGISALFILPAFLGHESLLVLPLIIVFYDYLFQEKKELKTYFLFFLLTIFYLELRFFSQALWLNGDYSYNLNNLPVNIIGNSISYFLGIFIGPQAFGFMYQLRLFFRDQKTLAYIISVAIMISCFILGKFLAKNKKINTHFIFLTGSFFISLLPFLGLGNVSERYAYFPSTFLILFAGLVLIKIYTNIKNKFFSFLIILFLTISLFIINLKEIFISKADWQKAGDITFKTLGLLRSNFLDKTSGKTFYVVNLPIRYNRAWVFPVGFEDGLGHVFGKLAPKVEKIGTIEEALKLQEIDPLNSYVFTFDNFEIKEVK